MPFNRRIAFVELCWLTAELKPLEIESSIEPKSLKEMCLEKLVSDVCLFRNLIGMPNYIHSMLLSTALVQNRTLSISQLMKYSPFKELKLPISASLKHWQSLITQKSLLTPFVEKYIESAITMLTTFSCLIEENCKTTKLEILDLGIFPLDSNAISNFSKFILCKASSKEKFSKMYTLKIAVTLTEQNDANQLLNVINIAKSLGLSIVLTGLDLDNCRFSATDIIAIMEKVEPLEFLHFSLNFTNIEPSLIPVLKKLQDFKNLKYLKFSYYSALFSRDPLMNILADTLNELPQLSHLILQGNRLTRCLHIILQKYCKKNNAFIKKSKVEDNKCCIVHDGMLEYLDISADRLLSDDILFLREMPLASNLKYLNVSYNHLSGLSGFQSLLALKSSLIILEMECAFHGHVPYSSEMFPFSIFTQLKYLNMKGLFLKQFENFPQFLAEKKKVPELLLIRDQLDVLDTFESRSFELSQDLFFLVPD